MDDAGALLGPMSGVEHFSFGPVEIDVARVGDARVKRMIYPPGLRWSTDLQPLVGTETCRHAHVGFLAQGAVHFEFPDGCQVDLVAPATVNIEPGHDSWVVGDGPAVIIQFDYEEATTARVGVPDEHRHDQAG